MSGTTEIYICQPGQAIKEGRMEMGSVDSRAQAEHDAESRLKLDPTIAKIAYYAVSEGGAFRCFYTKENPNVVKPKRKVGSAALSVGRGRAKKNAKLSLARRILAAIGLD